MNAAPDAVDRRLNWPVLAGFYAIAVAILVIRAVTSSAQAPLLADADDAMRLVVVRDFLNGQNWFDIVQHRLNAPFGSEIHWSRLIDLPLAMLIALLRPFGQMTAETIAVSVWPLMLLFLVLLASASICVRLLGREATLPGALLPTLSPAVMAEFTPGRIDHHGVQILLLLLLVLTTLGAIERPRLAILAGIVAATAIAIGTEALPGVAAAILIFFGLFVVDARRSRQLRLFGLNFAGASLVHLAIAAPPDRWLVPACDAISVVYVAAAVLVGISFALLSLLRMARVGPIVRLAVGMAVGLPLIALLYWQFPVCFSGPYAGLDRWLVENWLDRVTEARPLLESLSTLPDYAVAVALPVLVALVVLVRRVLTDKDMRVDWVVVLVFLAVASLVMLVQLRGARLATLMAVPGGALLIHDMRAHYLRTGRAGWAIGLAASWLVFAGVLIALGVGALSARNGATNVAATTGGTSLTRNACLLPGAYQRLAALPAQPIMGFVDLGSHILLYTGHSVVAAPYHRDQAGVIDALRTFNDPLDTARRIIDERGARLVVVCAGLPEIRGLPGAADDSLLGRIRSGALPDWLEPVSAPGEPLQIYRVRD